MKLGARDVVVVEIGHQFSSMGLTCTYKVEGHEYGYGLPLSVFGFELGDGDRFLVEVRRQRRLKKGPRFPKNPFQRRQKGAR